MATRSLRVRVAVCATRDDDILLVQHEKAGHRYWLLPGGGVEMGETLAGAASREFTEETGYTVDVGRLLILCEAIEPAGRHIVNLVFAGAITGGSLAVGQDRSLRDARWLPRAELTGLEMYPPIGSAVADSWAAGFAGPVQVLGNVWQARVPPGG